VATSGSWNYSKTAAQTIQAALENNCVYSVGETLSAADQALALARLNTVVKAMSGRIDMAGLKIWTRQRVTLFLAEGQQTYQVGPASGDARSTTQYGRTTIDAAEAAAQTTLSVTATTDTTTYPGTTVTMTTSDIIGIEQNDGTIFWSTISSVAAGDTVTIATGIDVAAAVGNYVWWFTSRAQRFVEIESATLLDENRRETPLGIYREVAAYEQGVVDKYADGDPTILLVEPLRITTRVTLDAQPTDVTKQIQLTVLYPAEDYDATTDDIAFPQEYQNFIEWELAMATAPAFGAPWTKDMEANRLRAETFAKSLNPEKTDAYAQCGSSE